MADDTTTAAKEAEKSIAQSIESAGKAIDAIIKQKIEFASAMAFFADQTGNAATLLQEFTGISAQTTQALEDSVKAFGHSAMASSIYNGTIEKLTRAIPLFGDAIADTNKAQYDAAASFAKATATGGEYGQLLHSITVDMVGYGLAADEVAKNTLALYQSFTDFSLGTVETQRRLSDFVNKLDAAGIGSDGVVSSLQTLSKGFGLTEQQAMQTILSLDGFAKSSHQSTEQVVKDFSSQADTFAVYGSQGVKVFEKLSAAAKATGMDMSKMLDIASGFDTFESAAESVGSLNAILGGSYLNSIELVMETDPTERMKMLKRALDEAGVSVNELGYYQKKAFVDAFGLENVTELTKLATGDFDKLASSIDAAATSEGELQARALAQMTPEERQKEMYAILAQASGMITELQAFEEKELTGFLTGTEQVSGAIKETVLTQLESLDATKELAEAIRSGEAGKLREVIASSAASTFGIQNTIEPGEAPSAGGAVGELVMNGAQIVLNLGGDAVFKWVQDIAVKSVTGALTSP